MQGLVHNRVRAICRPEHVAQVIAVGVHQFIDPLHPHRFALHGLDGEGGGVDKIHQRLLPWAVTAP
jgi:hypothetical protein